MRSYRGKRTNNAAPETALAWRSPPCVMPLLLLGLLVGCGGDGQGASVVTEPARLFFHEREFADKPALAALQKQIVVVDLEAAAGSPKLAENVSRHQLDAGTHRFCIEKNDPYLKTLILESSSGNPLVRLDAASECVNATLPAGTYRLRLLHDSSAISGVHRVAFVHQASPRLSLLKDDGTPKNGFWALRPDDPTGQQRVGRLRALPPPQSIDSFFYPSAEPIVADFASTQIDATALFNFENLGGNAPQGQVPFLLSGQFPLDLSVDVLGVPSSTFFANANGLNANNKFGFDPLQIIDLGKQKVQLQARTNLITGGVYSSFFIDTDSVVKWLSKPAAIPFLSVEVLFRFFPFGDPDGTQISLQEGEVALYQQCNYQGKATVIALDTPSFAALNSTTITLDKTTASVKLGPNAAALLYSEAGFTGTSATIEANTACLTNTPIGTHTSSIQIRPLLPIFLASSSCVNCNLSGVDLTGKSISEANLAGANLSGAILTNTSLHNAKSLSGANFTGATLFCTDFSGSPGALVDLRQTTFDNAKLTQDFSCRANFSYTHVDYLHPDMNVWRYLNFTQATLDSASGLGESALDLSNALLTGASLQHGFYPNVILTGANLAGANLTGTVFADMFDTHPVFSGAILDGVIGLAGTNLNGAVFSGASLQCLPLTGGGQRCVDLSGVTLTGAKFDTANLTGANLANTPLQGIVWQGAILDRVTGLAGSNLKGVVLSGASLQHVDFTKAQLDGAQFVGAMLQNAIFDKVTDLASAVLTGANFSGASFVGAVLTRISLDNATLDNVTGLAGTELSGVRFNGASLKGVDLSTAKLFGANFTNANLENASLAGAHLSDNPTGTPPINAPADFTGAHLKNVNLSGAQLQGTIFHFASFYGSFNVIGHGPPVFPCQTNTSQCGTTAVTGYTCSCASAVGAAMTRTDFGNAFLYGVDFSGSTTVINGVDFSNAILVGSNFNAATFLVDPSQGGAQPKFSGAFLQGVNLSTALLDNTSLDGAYVDFESGGNQMQVLLGPNFTAFNGWEAPKQSVCVQLDYTGFVTQVPSTTQNTTCPDSFQYTGGCGTTPPRPNPNPHWKAGIDIGQASPPGFYVNNATYTDANQNGMCNSNSTNFDW